MRLRRRNRCWIGLAAAVSLVAHAGVVARHGAASPGALQAPARLTADLARICHGRGTEAPAADIPEDRTGAEPDCAICVGLGPAVIAGAAMRIALSAAALMRADAVMGPARDWTQALPLRPPVRGPPAPAL